MKKTDSILLYIFAFGLAVPVLLGVIALMFGGMGAPAAHGFIKTLHDTGGFIFGTWMLLTVYLSFRLMLSETFREAVLARITFLKKADEREELLTGRAATSTFLAVTAFLFFLLVLSCFQVSIYRVPEAQAVNGKTGYITLGIGLNLWEKKGLPPADSLKKDIFTYSGLPVSNSTVIILLILLQIGAYNLYMRKGLK